MHGQLEPGTLIDGKYRVDFLLGEGGMGKVLAATDVTLERTVAIKMLRPELLDDADVVARFLREARAASRLSSEHTIKVHEVGELADGTPYIVMEFLSGRDLAAVIDGAHRTTIEQAVGYILQTLEAVAEAHALGIVHRDIKPANLFLTRRADSSALVKVLDFGLAKAPAGLTSSATTQSAAVFGSPQYMAPEQLRGASNVDPRCDVWALGVSLYELLTGELPFEGATVAEVSAMIMRDPPIPIESRRADLPLGLVRAIMRCLEKSPERRFPNVAELAAAIEPFAGASAKGTSERIWRVLFVSGTTFPSSASPDLPPAVGGLTQRSHSAPPTVKSESSQRMLPGSTAKMTAPLPPARALPATSGTVALPPPVQRPPPPAARPPYLAIALCAIVGVVAATLLVFRATRASGGTTATGARALPASVASASAGPPADVATTTAPQASAPPSAAAAPRIADDAPQGAASIGRAGAPSSGDAQGARSPIKPRSQRAAPSVSAPAVNPAQTY